MAAEIRKDTRKRRSSMDRTQPLHGDWLQWMMCIEHRLDQDTSPGMPSPVFPEFTNLKGVSV